MGKKITPIEQEQQQTHQYLWQDAPTEKNSFLPNPFRDTTPAINKVSSKRHNVFILGGRKVSVRPRTSSNCRQRKLGYFHEYSHIYWSVLCHWGHDIQKAVNADKKWHQGSKQKQVKLCNRTVELQTRYLKTNSKTQVPASDIFKFGAARALEPLCKTSQPINSQISKRKEEKEMVRDP